ncbi:hypothetical protein EVA_17122 [gut metagenome]|uniref:Uncharacterized protein n=1 Tax=gut metagenome TaxID=749906 RepID=J9FYZ4_9ZZZZ
MEIAVEKSGSVTLKDDPIAVVFSPRIRCAAGLAVTTVFQGSITRTPEEIFERTRSRNA